MDKHSEQYYAQKQAEFRTVMFNPESSEEELAAAQEEWNGTLEEYQSDHPLITGPFIYTEEDAKDAKRHGF